MPHESRTEMLIGKDGIKRLKEAHVAVFGLGGVGCAAAEALARAQIGTVDITDCDVYDETNLNRQLFATLSTTGKRKTEVAAQRIKDISPNTAVIIHDVFFADDVLEQYDFESYDYVIDALDTVSAKLLICEICAKYEIPLISCMGTGNKLDAARFEVCDIFATKGCPLARIMRKELKKRNISSLKVVYSAEEPVPAEKLFGETGKPIPASVPFVPPVAGFTAAGEAFKYIVGISGKDGQFPHK